MNLFYSHIFFLALTGGVYAQNDEHMRNMEKEAYLQGNLLMRDFEDNFKYQQ